MYELTGQEEHVNDGGPIARVGMPTPRRFHPPDKINGDHDWSRVDAPGESLAARRPEPRRRRFVPSAWVMAALAAIAVAEGVAIARFATARVVPAAPSPVVMIESTEPGDTVTVDGQRVGQTPLRLTVNGRTRAIRLARADNPVPILAVTAASEPAPSEAAAIEHAAARQRSGGVRFASPIDLQVLEGDRVLGSTADGPIVATAGTHQLDLINAALGYRAHQTVTIRAGVLIPVTITPPMGRLSINAEPWAQVFIDDKLIGDTPLANVAVSLGQHQVTFRNPQAGERRETVTIRADAPARVSTTFQR
jgi:hypothetical protein